MKLLAVLAVATAATAAVIERDASKEARSSGCHNAGQPCWVAKRVADAFAGTISGFDQLTTRNPNAIPFPGEGAYATKAKRAVEGLGNVIAVARNVPEYYSNLMLEKKFAPEQGMEKREANPWCHDVGQPCWKRAVEEDKRWCHDVGQPCWKRAVEEDKRWCHDVGQPCWKAKRAAEAALDAMVVKERDAEPEPAPWCHDVGQPCWKEKREATPEPEPEPEPWCHDVGQPCWKARRDLDVMRHAARSILEAVE